MGDSTELTFVRCPSCRSLVPAVSTRCRMCGASLDVDNPTKDEEETVRKNSGRVRQRTMSDGDDEMMRAKNMVREAISHDFDDQQEHEENVAAEEEADNSFIDPLSAYIEEMDVDDVEEDAPSNVDEDDEQEPNDHAAEEEDNDDDDVLFADDEETEEEDDYIPFLDHDEVSPDEEDEVEEDEEPVEEAEAEDEDEAEEDDEEYEESAFEEEEEEPEDQSSIEAAAPEPQEEWEDEEEDDIAEEDSEEYEEEIEQEEEPVVQVAKEENKMESRDQRNKPQNNNKKNDKGGVQVKSSPKNGRLFGWFVSYDTPGGRGIELREGKFFITRSSLKDSDFVLDNPSISTPHALVNITVEDGMRLQDLMSERGVFVRRRGDDTYQREEEIVVLENGDWVRFGDVEFLVSLIPHVGVR